MSSEGSVKSAFQFITYKIDRFSLESQTLVDLVKVRIADEKFWKADYGFRTPYFFKQRKEYVGGINLRLQLFDKPSEEAQDEDEPLVKLEAGIVGIFSVDNERLPSQTEENMVKHILPAILMPYLRAAVTSFLANAGWPGVFLPLVNMYEMAKEAELEIEEAD